jgi:hypothetical protein
MGVKPGLTVKEIECNELPTCGKHKYLWKVVTKKNIFTKTVDRE